MKLNIKKWEYDGMKLKPIHLMFWALLWFPVAYTGIILFTLASFMVEGKNGAKRAWRDVH